MLTKNICVSSSSQTVALTLVRFDQVASVIVNANHRIMYDKPIVAVHFSSHAECRIASAITEITHSGEVVEAHRIIGGANRDNLSVGLDQNRKGIVFEPDKISCDLAAIAKCGVRGSIRVVTRQRKIGIGRLARIKATKMVPAAMILPSGCKATSNA
jgi:hypothetical protein